MYKVISDFRDKDRTDYKVGDVYPAEGKQLPTKERLNVLSTNKNAYQRVFIEKSRDVVVEGDKSKPKVKSSSKTTKK